MSFFNRGKSGNKGSKSNMDPNLNPWAKPAKNDQNQQGSQQQNNQQGGQQNQQNNAQNNEVAFDRFCRDNGMFDGVDFQGFMKAVREGDADVAGEVFSRAMISVAKVAMTGADKLASAKMQKLMEETTQRAVATTQTNLITQEMHNRLGFTSNPAIAPIAEQVLNGFLARGDAADVAVENVEKYFQQFATMAGDAFGMTSRGGNGMPGTRGFQDSRMQQNNNSGENDTDGGETDWVDFLTSGTGIDANARNTNNGSQGGNSGNQGTNSGSDANSAAA